MDKLLCVKSCALLAVLLLCAGCGDVGFRYRSDTSIGAEAPLQQAGVYVYVNGSASEVRAALEYISAVEIYDAAAATWLPLQGPEVNDRAHPKGQGFVAGGYLAPGEYPRLRVLGGDTVEAQIHELSSGIDRLDAGMRICMFLWGRTLRKHRKDHPGHGRRNLSAPPSVVINSPF